MYCLNYQRNESQYYCIWFLDNLVKSEMLHHIDILWIWFFLALSSRWKLILYLLEHGENFLDARREARKKTYLTKIFCREIYDEGSNVYKHVSKYLLSLTNHRFFCVSKNKVSQTPNFLSNHVQNLQTILAINSQMPLKSTRFIKYVYDIIA